MAEGWGAALLGLAVLLAVWVWAKRRRGDAYDLRRLQDAPRTGMYDSSPLGAEEEAEVGVADEDSGPYCLSCDEAYPAGTPACPRCGRRL